MRLEHMCICSLGFFSLYLVEKDPLQISVEQRRTNEVAAKINDKIIYDCIIYDTKKRTGKKYNSDGIGSVRKNRHHFDL